MRNLGWTRRPSWTSIESTNFLQDCLHGRDLPLPQGYCQISPQRGNSFLVGLVVALQIDGFDLVLTGPKLTPTLGELLDPWPTLSRGHRTVLEGSQVAVNGDLGLLQLHLDVVPLVSALTADLASAFDSNGKGLLDEVEIREDGSDRFDNGFFELAGR